MSLPSHTAPDEVPGEHDLAAEAGSTGRRFIITLCDSPAPVKIPSTLAGIRRFRFFGPGVRGAGPPYRIHMGYFATRGEAEKWLGVVRPAFPDAMVGELPVSVARRGTLTDTGVMRVLEHRRVGASGATVEDPRARKIPLLAPEETAKWRALKDAVRQGEPVSFVVQLQWSSEPIDVRALAWDPIFRFYTLYSVRARHDGREWCCLRLGFFSDAISAKQVALYLRSSYESAAVVPAGSQEKAEAMTSGVKPPRRGDSCSRSDGVPGVASRNGRPPAGD